MVYKQRIYDTYASYRSGGTDDLETAGAQRATELFVRSVTDLLPAEKDAAILDAGCGSGELLSLLARQGFTNLHGVDISPRQVERSRQRGLSVEQGDAIEYLSGQKEAYSVIWALDLVEHLNKDEVLRFLDACFAALSPSGKLILRSVNADSPFFASFMYGDITHETCFTPGNLQRILELVGFRECRLREVAPHPHSIYSTLRWMVWKILRLQVLIWSLAETGCAGSGVFTRNFIAAATKI